MSWMEGDIKVFRMKAYAPLEELLNIIRVEKGKIKIFCVSKDLTITKYGFKMVQRECIGGTYLYERL